MKLKLTEKEREYFRKQGRKGGKIGGKARMAQLTPEQRRELASKAGKKSAEARTYDPRPPTHGTTRESASLNANSRLGKSDREAREAAGARGAGGAIRGVTMNRYWLSWYQHGPDHRPLTYPPNGAILGWWCSGFGSHGGFEDVDILCALVEAESEDAAWAAVLKDWPDMIDHRFIEERESGYVIDNNRFTITGWMIPRMRIRE